MAVYEVGEVRVRVGCACCDETPHELTEPPVGVEIGRSLLTCDCPCWLWPWGQAYLD